MNCKIKNPMKCDYSLFIESPDGNRYVICCPEYWKMERNTYYDIKDKVKLWTNWTKRECPYPCEKWE
jgi:hypothetical protein